MPCRCVSAFQLHEGLRSDFQIVVVIEGPVVRVRSFAHVTVMSHYVRKIGVRFRVVRGAAKKAQTLCVISLLTDHESQIVLPLWANDLDSCPNRLLGRGLGRVLKLIGNR